MTEYHVLRRTKSTGRAARYAVVRKIDNFLGGQMILEFVPGQSDHWSAETAFLAIKRLQEEDEGQALLKDRADRLSIP